MMKARIVVGALIGALSFGSICSSAPAAVPPLAAPHVFELGVPAGPVNDGSPTFSPDGKTLLFARSGGNWSVVMQAQFAAGRWSEPRIAPFSGEWSDWAPEISPDGRFAVYVEVRERKANLWRVDRTADGWGTPVRLPDAVNIGPSIWKPSIAGDGSIYFVSITAKGEKRLYVSRRVGGVYQPAQPLPFSDGTTGDVDPEVSPDESALYFASNGRIAGDTRDHLFVAIRVNGVWNAPERLRYDGDDANGGSTDNEPHFGADHRSLYFSSDRSIPIHFPRTRAQAERDFARIRESGNGSVNAWVLQLPAGMVGYVRAGPSFDRLRMTLRGACG